MMNNAYVPYGYPSYSMPNYNAKPYTPQPQQMPMQSQMPTQMQPQTPMAQQSSIQEVRHGTKEEIEAHIVYPNCVVYFIDYPRNRLYAKKADASGMSYVEYYSLTPITADGTPIKPQEPMPQVNFDDYIKREDISKLGFATADQFNALSQKLEQLQKKLEGVKPNVGTTKQAEARVQVQ